MKFIKTLFIFIFLVQLNACSGDKKEEISIIQEEDIELQMIDAYKEGLKSLKENDILYAVKKFNEAEALFPQSDWAPKASLMAAYAYYKHDYYGDSIRQLENFLKTYPLDERVVYAHFLIGMCYFESIIDEKKDLDPLIKAEQQFKYVIKKYPESDFAIDAKFKIELIRDILAAKEIYIAKYYIKKRKWIAAINRYKKVIYEYETTVYVEEAMHRLVELHYKIGLIDESKKYASLLGYNYQSSEWYKQSYKIFNSKYENPVKKIKKKKNKKSIIKRFKSLFE